MRAGVVLWALAMPNRPLDAPCALRLSAAVCSSHLLFLGFAFLSRLVYPPASSCIFPRAVPRQAPVFTPFPVVAPGEFLMKHWFRAGGPFSRVFQDLPLQLPLHPSQFSIFLPPSIVCFVHPFWRFLPYHLSEDAF